LLPTHANGYKQRDWNKLLKKLGFELERVTSKGEIFYSALYGKLQVGVSSDPRANKNALAELRRVISVVEGDEDETDTTPEQEEVSVEPIAKEETTQEVAEEPEKEPVPTTQHRSLDTTKMVSLRELSKELSRENYQLVRWAQKLKVFVHREEGHNGASFVYPAAAAKLREYNIEARRKGGVEEEKKRFPRIEGEQLEQPEGWAYYKTPDGRPLYAITDVAKALKRSPSGLKLWCTKWDIPIFVTTGKHHALLHVDRHGLELLTEQSNESPHYKTKRRVKEDAATDVTDEDEEEEALEPNEPDANEEEQVEEQEEAIVPKSSTFNLDDLDISIEPLEAPGRRVYGETFAIAPIHLLQLMAAKSKSLSAALPEADMNTLKVELQVMSGNKLMVSVKFEHE